MKIHLPRVCKPTKITDKCQHFDDILLALVELYKGLKDLKGKIGDTHTIKAWLGYTTMAIIQLVNGLRVRETVEAIKLFYETGERRLALKANKGGGIRRIIVPSFIEREDVDHVYRLMFRSKFMNPYVSIKNTYNEWLSKHLGLSTHTLRHAFINKALEMGLSEEEIAEAIGMKKPRNIRLYARAEEEEEGEE